MINNKFFMATCLAVALGMTNIPSYAEVGSVTVTKDDGKATIEVTTSKGGTSTTQIDKSSKSTTSVEEITFLHQTTATSANGNNYSSKGETIVQKSYGPNDQDATLTINSNHGEALANKRMSKVSGNTTIVISQDSKSITHGNSSGEAGNIEYHTSYTSITQDNNGTTAERSAFNNLVGPNKNLLQTNTATTITHDANGFTVEHPNANSQYILINGQPIR